MKKITLILITAILAFNFNVWSQVFITELADPNNASGARFVELYNAGTTSIDFSTGWQLQRATNGNASWQTAKNLTGTIPAGGFYIVCNNQTTFTSTYGFAADQNIGGGGPADSNGDDQIRLLSPGAVVEDMFGVLGEDGSGTNHEFEDGRAERKATITSGNTTYDFGEWNIWNDTGGSGTTNSPRTAPGDFDPGAWIGSATPPVSTPTFNPPAGEYLNNPQSVTISTTTSGATIYYTTDGNNPDNTSTVYAGSINIAVNTTLKAFAEKSGEPDSQITSGDYVITPATTTLPYEENFDADLGDCYRYSVSGNTKDWYWHSGGYAVMNGYNSGDVEEDWLILPRIDFDGSYDYMKFDTWGKYGSDDDNNYLKLMYSTDYSGLGDPSSATWAELSFTQPSSDATWASSGTIWLSSITGPAYIAFKYQYESGSYRKWQVDNISIKDAPPVPLGSTGIIIAVLLITTVLVIRRGRLI